MRTSRYFAPQSNSIVIQADESRKQADNSHQCFVKLNSLISEAAEQAVPGETSDEQKQHVLKLYVPTPG
jgi:peptidyl-tRNA hydrolase ICT1